MKKETISKFVFFLLLISLLSGFQSIYILGFVINLQAWINLFLFCMLLINFLIFKKRSTYFLLLLLLFLIYSVVGILNSASINETLKHLFTYIDFIVAVMLLEMNIGYEMKKVFFYFTITASIGAISANVIQFFFPSIMTAILKNQDLESVLSWGRVSWVGAVITLPLMAQFTFLEIYSKKERLLLIPAMIVVIVGTLLSFNRTFLISIMLLLLYVTISNFKQLRIKHLFFVVSLFLLGNLFINYWSKINTNFNNLLNYRIYNFLNGKADISNDVSTRAQLYSQYIERIGNDNFLGQGFGIPFSLKPDPRTWSDITFVSFLIPLGIVGLVFFLIFIHKVYRLIDNKIVALKVRRAFYLILFLGLVISFNDDIWTHTNFPIYLIFGLNSFGYKRNQIKI